MSQIKNYIRLKLKKWKTISYPILILNFIVQRLFRVNASSPWGVNYTSRVLRPENIIIGSGVDISMACSGHCYISGKNGIVIGDGTIFGPGVKIISANHRLENYELSGQKASPITIGKKCWLGANAVLLPEVILGDNVIVAAGAVVTHSFPSNCVIAGVPAKILRMITPAPD